jgi:serine/threonine protein kinase/tetratricopeptide (TPR) repeat protein
MADAQPKYKILGEVGRGGMGVVLKARDTSLDRIVALKVLPRHFSENINLLKRFQREAKAAAGLNHPNIVTVYSMGCQDGRYYIAMEFVDGISLAQVILSEGRQDVQRAINFIRQVADALAEAHSRDIIHRDIKPANIMLDKNGRIHVTDFGLARVLQEETALTTDGSRLGTPRYMSPEQCEGKPLTFHTDIYSLGVTLFELLAGCPAFPAENSLAIMRQIVDNPFPNILGVNNKVPREVAQIIEKMVAKKSEDRYPSAQALINDLDEWLRTGRAPGCADVILDDLSREALIALLPPLPPLPEDPFTARTRELPKKPEIKDKAERDFPVHFIVHFVESDRTWAEWIHMQLTEAGYVAELAAWDFKMGHESLREIVKAVEQSVSVFVVVSSSYLTALYGHDEWVQAYRAGTLKVMPIRVRACNIGNVLGTLNYIDMLELSAEKAKAAILKEAREKRGAPLTKSQRNLRQVLAETTTQKLVHTVWNVPFPSNHHFTGRDKVLSDIYHTFSNGGGKVALQQANPVQSGMGLTQIAVEYAYLNKSNYGLVWWLRSSEDSVLTMDYVALAAEVDLPEKNNKNIGVMVKAVKKWLSDNTNWLLIFDEAPTPQTIASLIPTDCEGHVLITSPNSEWPSYWNPLTVQALDRNSSVDFLFRQTKERNEGAAAALAAAVADVPLALNLAGACVAAARISLDQYIDLFLDRHKAFWGFADPPKDAVSVTDTALSLTLGYLAGESQGALDLLRICAYLAPTDTRLARLCAGAKLFPKTLAKTLSNTAKLDEAISTLKRYAVVEERQDSLSVHSLVQELTARWLETDPAEEKNDTRAWIAERIQRARFGRTDRRTWPSAALQYVVASFPEYFQAAEKWSECDRLLPHAVVVLKHAERLGVSPGPAADMWRRLGHYWCFRTGYGHAVAAFEQAIALHEKAFGPLHKGLAMLYKELADIHCAQSELMKARTGYEKALAIELAVYKQAHEEVARTYFDLGNVLMQMGVLPEARQYYMKALDTDKKAQGPDHEDVGRDYNNLGLVSQELGDLTSAWEYYRKALEICEAAFGEQHPRVAAAVKNLAGLLQQMGDLKSAKDLYQRAVKIDTALHGEHHSEVGQDYNNLGVVLQGLGFTNEALLNYKKALTVHEAVYGKKHPKVAINMNNVANIMWMQGDMEGAESYFNDALKVLIRTLGENHDKTQTVINNLRKVRGQGKKDESGPKALA